MDKKLINKLPKLKKTNKTVYNDKLDRIINDNKSRDILFTKMTN